MFYNLSLLYCVLSSLYSGKRKAQWKMRKLTSTTKKLSLHKKETPLREEAALIC